MGPPVRPHILAPVLAASLVVVLPAFADPQVVTLLVTADENGQLLPTTEGDAQKGGAAQMLGRWTAEDKHCPGPAKKDGAASCPGGLTLALSTGDHWNGSSLSTFFQGEPVAEAMARMGYAASGFGNHELDFGRDQFLALRDAGGFPFVAANVKVVKAAAKQLEMPPWRIFTRGDARVGVIALSVVEAAKTSMADRFFGLQLLPYESSIGQAVKELRKAGVDAVVVLADECPAVLEPVVKKHPEWSLALVVGGHCKKQMEQTVGTTPLINPGRRFEGYARARLTFDTAKPTGQRLTGVDAKVVQVLGGPAAPPPDAALVEMIKPWLVKHDAALGERIGFTRSGLDAGSAGLYTWVSRAIREMLKTDVVILNKGGFRAGLPAGPITRGSVYGVLPFDNSLMTFKLKGDALLKALANPNGVSAGVTKSGNGWKDSQGREIVATGVYSVGSVEYLYFGGDGFGFEKQDPLPGETGMVWQTAVVDWTKRLATNESRPLENFLH
jgi:2',3'-cyclic-nucleotide 2'-phosphodiesterase (5'-nucleotidase family)